MLCCAPDGTLSLKDKARNRKAALNLLVNQLKRSITPETELETVLICHTDCEEDAKALAETIRSAVSVKEVAVVMMGPVIGAHLGPGAVTLSFEAGMTRDEYEGKFY